MWGRLGARIAAALLKNARLGNEDRQLLTAALLRTLGAVPIRATITMDSAGKLFVGGRELNLETARKLRAGADAMITNFARKFVREQLMFLAVEKGVHENLTPEQGLFAKALLWNFQEEEKLFRELAQVDAELE